MLFGWIGDKVSSRRDIFLLGLVLLGVTTLTFALGTTLWILLIARIFQGLSSAVSLTLGAALLLDVVGKDNIGKALGYTGMGLTLGILIGPVLGGVLYEYGGYFQVFLPAFGLIGIEIVLRMLVLDPQPGPSLGSHREESQANTWNGKGPKCRYGGTDTTQPFQTATATEQSIGSTAEQQPGWLEDGETQACVLGHVSSRPVLISLLASPRVSVAILSLFILNSIGTGFDGVLPAYINDAFGLRAVDAAIFFVVFAVPSLLGPISGALADKLGPKWPAVSGFLLATTSLFLLQTIIPGCTSPAFKLGVLMFLIGLAFTLTMPPMMTEVSRAVEDAERRQPGIFGPGGAYSQAYGLMGTAFAGGSLIGPLYAGFVRVSLGWPAMSMLMGSLSLVAMVLVFLVTGRPGLNGDNPGLQEGDSIQ